MPSQCIAAGVNEQTDFQMKPISDITRRALGKADRANRLWRAHRQQSHFTDCTRHLAI
jgi:hypothetical protein